MHRLNLRFLFLIPVIPVTFHIPSWSCTWLQCSRSFSSHHLVKSIPPPAPCCVVLYNVSFLLTPSSELKEIIVSEGLTSDALAESTAAQAFSEAGLGVSAKLEISTFVAFVRHGFDFS